MVTGTGDSKASAVDNEFIFSLHPQTLQGALNRITEEHSSYTEDHGHNDFVSRLFGV